jgi:hypothetical protein
MAAEHRKDKNSSDTHLDFAGQAKWWTVMVQHAGGDFVGVQDAWPEYGLPPYVLFNHPKHGATLAIRLDENFSTSAILRRLEECEKKYGDHT